MGMLKTCKALKEGCMGSKRTVKRPPMPASENTDVAKTAPDESKADVRPDEKMEEEPFPGVNAKTAVTPSPKLSKRALKRMRGWEPVIKPPEDIDSLLPSVTSTAGVVWLDNNTSVTLIPNNNTGVHTRRGAASLAVASPPTSYRVYTRDPLIKMGRPGQQNVHVITSFPTDMDSRNAVLRGVPSISSVAHSNSSSSRTASRGSKDLSSLSSLSFQRQNREACEGETEGAVDTDNDDMGEEEERAETVTAEEEEEEEETAVWDENNTVTALQKQKQQGSRTETMSSTQTQSRNNDIETTATTTKKKKQKETLKKKDCAQQQQRIGGLSAAQAMLPPPYRRNRRLRRKLRITEETPVFAVHSELRDTTPHIFARAPFSTEEDVLRSTLDWQDDPALLYARLLWEFAPNELLCRAMQQHRDNLVTVVPKSDNFPCSESTAEVMVKKKEKVEVGKEGHE